METNNPTELSESLNNNKYLVTSSEPVPSTSQNNTMNIYFSRCNIFGYIFFLFAYSIFPFFIMYFQNSILGISFLMSHIFILIFILLFCKSKIELKKDIPSRTINIIEKSYLRLNRMNLYISQENIHFHKSYEIKSGQEDDYTEYYVYIINNHKDLKDIDLKTSNIKQEPADLFYYYNNLKDNTDCGPLNDFVGSPRQFNNPLLFDIVKYMNNKSDPNHLYNIPSIGNQLSKLMRFNDHFFTYYFGSPLEKRCCCDDNTGFYAIPIVNFLAWPLAINLALVEFSKFYMRFIGIALILIFNCICLLHYLCKRTINVRIDFIYSKDFDEIFIGVVSKATKYLYRYTFEYQMKNVNKFILDRRTNTLKVELKNNVFETIFRFTNLEKTYSDGIIYLLNEKLNVI